MGNPFSTLWKVDENYVMASAAKVQLGVEACLNGGLHNGGDEGKREGNPSFGDTRNRQEIVCSDRRMRCLDPPDWLMPIKNQTRKAIHCPTSIKLDM
uniref:Uncharacterized protein n=1 Tax=Oryza barthii TaxID=65489 RepID=A0A0D3G3A3_9ORYZ